jgi:hypothetical protein
LTGTDADNSRTTLIRWARSRPVLPCPAKPRPMTTTAARTKPFFRADHVGSLLRPAEVFAGRESFERGEIDAGRLRAVEDAAIHDVVVGQERIGLEIITDGEFRR